MNNPVGSWYCVWFDETKDWNLTEEQKAAVKEIRAVYIFDKSSITHLCELQPSYLMIGLPLSIVYHDHVTEEERDEIEWVFSLEGDSDTYMHCSYIEKVPEERFHKYQNDIDPDCEDRGEAEVREYYQGNPKF